MYTAPAGSEPTVSPASLLCVYIVLCYMLHTLILLCMIDDSLVLVTVVRTYSGTCVTVVTRYPGLVLILSTYLCML